MLHEPKPMTSNPSASGKLSSKPPRLITPEELALLCRMQRHWRGWTQETLAEITGLQVRSIQRVEKGEPSSADTRRALARAFGADDLDIFNKPDVFPTPEESEARAKAEKEAFERDFSRLAVAPATGLSLVRELNGCGAVAADVVDETLLSTKEARAAWAALVDNVRDYGDILSEISETGRMEAADHLDEMLAALGRQGIILHLGTRRMVSGQGEKAFRFRVVQLVGGPRGRTVTEVVVAKRPEMGI